MRSRRPVSGLSLLELLVAVAVFAVAFVMLLTAFPTAARAVRQGQEYINATFLAERCLEQVRSQAYDDVVDGTYTVQVTTNNQGVELKQDFSVQTLVSEPQTNLKRVRVLVSWSGERARHVEVFTDVARLR
jgi:type II secretory pathway pseudopilin PulG